METNENAGEKKPRRPRISESNVYDGNAQPQGYRENNTDHQENGSEYNPGYRQQRPGGYQQRSYNNSNYQQRQGGYNRGGYQQRSYGQSQYQRPYNRPTDDTANDSAEGMEQRESQQQGGYQQRSYNPNYKQRQQGGYQQHSYNPNYKQRQQGGYQQGPRQGGGYNRGGQQGGGYNRGGGYQQGQRQGGGYNRGGQQGGYNRGGQNRGGYNRGGQNGMPRPGKSFTPRPKPIEYEFPTPDPNEQIRLNKYMANAGICSRREADEFIQQGLVKVNGEVVTELGTKITHADTVEYDEKVVTLERKCYILLNKPKDCVTTTDDPNGRTTVLDLVKGACNERIYPVGRLDRNTTGVLLLTNDGDLASKLTHPQYVKKKIYHVWTDKDISEDDMQRIADGIELDDGPIHADAISYATETDRNQAGIEIHSGRNRIVRRIFESLGYHVTKLDRVYFAGLTKKNLPRGRWRYLTQEEVNILKMGSFE
ncbi:MAG: RNA-binding S4 domain-containing protein [Muribaculaceae bacterium]|nr:RNA-binding S4 domain-containing protein [Muribaculaceae bacterium]